MRKRVLSVFLLVSILLSVFSCAHAESVQPRYSHIYSISVGIDLNGSSLWCYGEGDSMFNDTTTQLTVVVFRHPIDGDGWSVIAGWNDYSSGVIPALVDTTIEVLPGYEYRVGVHIIIKDADGNMLESDGMSSHIVTYPLP